MATQLYKNCFSSFSLEEKPKILGFAKFFYKTILDQDAITGKVLPVFVWIPQL